MKFHRHELMTRPVVDPKVERVEVVRYRCAKCRKTLARQLKKIKGYQKEQRLLREALRELDRAAGRAIKRLHREFAKARPPRKGEKQSPAYAMRMLCLDLLENWGRLTCYQKREKPLRDNLGRKVPRSYQVPETNNACENTIGRTGKIRHKAMRAYKSLGSAILITFLLASLRGVLAGVSYTSLLT